jgi:hypothetical protein
VDAGSGRRAALRLYHRRVQATGALGLGISSIGSCTWSAAPKPRARVLPATHPRCAVHTSQRAQKKSARAISADEFADAGLGPLPPDQPDSLLYVDLMKRALINVIYYESSQALWVYGPDHVFRLCDGFSLGDRVVGEDMPGNAMTMVGLQRLNNIEQVSGARKQ